jgi:hypothetical protein
MEVDGGYVKSGGTYSDQIISVLLTFVPRLPCGCSGIATVNSGAVALIDTNDSSM